ncbi:flagellar assembly protein FliH [Hafnia alvei]|uniref:Flagellar assembly protein FliH n=1 Tax=Hafnia alvei ATCC 51873 TaxID=1002364 RepID=G9YDH9_HAFAL|nr:flagellar assembly protein FliH [Hafnia alvei]EHM37689.1 flagellar assembly protein FliH [Hafnia alvei ATCC 51873]QQE42900.1 flagellar assembly protein H [Hafnia alvei]
MYKENQKSVFASLNSRRATTSGQTIPRQRKFPPLRKSWQKTNSMMSESGEPALSLDPAEYQKQLMDGFQDGLNRGFAQGIEEGKEEGYQEGVSLGFEEGMRKGLAEGKQAGKQQFLEAAEPIDTLARQLQCYLESYELRRREELLQLVEKVTRQVIRCELTLQPTQMLALVEEALSSLPQIPDQIKVYLNAEEFRRISEAEPDKAREWGLCADAEMAPGECRVVTDTTEMDIGCQHRLDQCMDVLQSSLLPDATDEQAA